MAETKGKAPAGPSPRETPLEKLFRSLPNVDASHIGGNLSAADKQLDANKFFFFIAGTGGAPNKQPFAGSIGARLKIVEMNITEEPPSADQTMEIEVTQDMCNAFGNMHGACGAFLLGHAAMGAIVQLGHAKGYDNGSLVATAQNLQNMNWHTPANIGEVLTIRAETVFVDNKNRGPRLASCEIREKNSGRLILTGTVGGVPSMHKSNTKGGAKL
ncbi:hypothetical protein MIND_00382900 [Mycena indigotica]|uniref:Thioesterase domain-containing protein n=1 Tax=Mycena indigotica TaxID=2126181 RepID=A0A8H6WBC8_9AGAR|nr:uncharacterized protein MIND_00382900 [Mycena indigotica]KAF7310096.1 hypothetical protein MIND_00382900 [Mycena indigotica]